MGPFDFLKKYRLAVLRSPADGEGGGAGDGGSGSEASAEVAAGAAGDPPPPATTFLTEVGKTAETPPVEDAPPAEGEAAKTEDAPAAFDLAAVTLPEGVTLDAEVGVSFAEILSNAELSPQERGQKLLDLHTSALKTVSESVATQLVEANMAKFTEMNNTWRQEILQLPEFKDNPEAEGGKVMQALLAIGADEKFFDALNLTGAGNHPAILQVLHRLTKPFMEGGAVSGAGAPGAKRELGANIYNSTSKE